MLRREKASVQADLPQKTEKILRCPLSAWQQQLYHRIAAPEQVPRSLLWAFRREPSHPAKFQGWHGPVLLAGNVHNKNKELMGGGWAEWESQ